MKSLCIAVLLLLLPGTALAQAPARGCADDNTALALSERAERLVPRDRLQVELRVDATDSDAVRLQETINRRLAAAIETAKSAPQVMTASGTYQVYQEQPKGQPVRWHGTASLSLSGRDTQAVLALASRLQQEGLVFSQLSYDLSPEAMKAVENELSDQALTRLKERAAHIAATLGLTVERLCDVTVGSATSTQPVMFMRDRAIASAASPAPVSGEAGEAPVFVMVNARLRLAPKH